MSDFVLDCSIAMAWHFEDEREPYSDGVLSSLRDVRALVPGLFACEVLNALAVAERRGRTTSGKAGAFLEDLWALPLVVEPALSLRNARRILELTRTYSLSAYDGTYLELAERLDLPLATGDQRLKSAAAEAGVAILALV